MATIKSIETAGWANVPEGRLVLGSGLNVIREPNEAGKSSVVAAVGAGLYEDGGTSSEVFRRRFHKWNDDGPFYVRLEFEHDGQSYVLTRDFDEKTNSLVGPDGKSIRDKRKIAVVVEEAIGLPTLKSFTASACIRQEDIAAVCGESSLRELLERQIAGTGSDTGAILKSLDRAAAGILGKSGRSGELADLRADAEGLERLLSDKKDRLQSLLAAKKELASLEKELGIRLLELDTDQATYDGFRRFREAEEEDKRANLEFEAAQESVIIHKEASKEAKRAGLELKAVKKKAASLRGEIEAAEKRFQLELSADRLEKDALVTRKKLEAIAKLDKRIEALDRKLNKAIDVPRKDLFSIRALHTEVSGLHAALSSSTLGLEVQPEASSPFVMTVDGQTVKGKRAEANVEAEVRFPGAGAVKVRNLTGEKEPLIDAIAANEKKLAKLLNRFGATDVDELEKLHAEREDLVAERGRLDERKNGILGDDDVLELRAHLRDLESELAKAELNKRSTKGAGLTRDALKEKKEDLRSSEEEQRELERILAETNGVFNVLGKDGKTVKTALDKAVKRLALADAAVRENAPFSCSKGEYVQKERKLERLRVKVEDLKAGQTALEVTIALDKAAGIDDIAGVEELLERKQAAIVRFESERSVLTTIATNIRQAREAAVVGLAGGMSKRMATLLSEITDSKYRKTEVDGNLDMSVYSPDKGSFIELGNGDDAFSSGARDQVYLSARIALLEAITGDSRTPLILDDTFANFDDMGRKARAFELLEAIAAHRQVIFLTCHECPKRIQPIAISRAVAAGKERT